MSDAIFDDVFVMPMMLIFHACAMPPLPRCRFSHAVCRHAVAISLSLACYLRLMLMFHAAAP